MNKLVSPSVLSADFGHLTRDIEMLDKSSCDWIHCDIMDGVFVPNISFGFPVIKAIRKATKKPLDVHLMVEDSGQYIQKFADVGADILTVHYEGNFHIHRTVSQIRKAGMKAGVAINPGTPVDHLSDLLNDVDMVLIMSVNPGFGGQSFIPNSLLKVAQLNDIRRHSQHEFLIQVDGGVNGHTSTQLFEAGADCLVAGSYVFGAKDPAKAISHLKAGGDGALA